MKIPRSKRIKSTEPADTMATPFGIESFTLVGPNGPWSFPFPPAPPPAATTAPAGTPDPDDEASGGS